MIIPGRAPVIKRLPVRVDYTDGAIQRFDKDNLYPQRAKETMYRSYTLTGIIEKLAGFLNGEGFVDANLNSIIVDDDGTTLRELLDKVSQDFAWANSFALHFQYDLNYQIAQICHVPVEYCRLGIPDDDGEVEKIVYCTNWERDYLKEKKARRIIEYDRFDPNPEEVAEQIEECGGIEFYKGQIYYFSLEGKDQYSKASFDAVFEQAQTQAEIALYVLNNVVNGFTAGHIMMYPGRFQDDTERATFKNRLKEHKGSMGANSIMVIETGTGDGTVKAGDLLVKTDLPNNDKMFEFTLNWIEKSILQNYGMPYEILGKVPDTGLFTKQQVEDAYTYYNAVTRDKRTILSRELSKIFMYWSKPIVSDFKILDQRYTVDSTALPSAPASAQPSAGAQPQAAEATVDPAQKEIDSLIRSLSRRDVSKIFKYVDDYKNGRTTLEQAKTFLRPFLQTDANINLFIQDPEGDGQ